MRRGTRVWGLLLLVSCVSAPGPRTGPLAPVVLPGPEFDYPVPTATVPLRVGLAPVSVPEAPQVWSLPVLPAVPSLVVAPEALEPSPSGTSLPLPRVNPLPIRVAPSSRSWVPVAQVKAVDLPKPAPPATGPAKGTTKPAAKATGETKAPATVPVTSVPPVKPAASAPSTPAASASLLPVDQAASADFQWQDVNAVAGDAVTLHFDKANWLYLDPPAQQKTLGFQSISREKTATTFQFRPLTPGQYTLEFQRQDLTNQSTEVRKVKLVVVPVGTRTASTGTALAPQTSSQTANDALEASRLLAAAGKTSEAVQKLLQGYKADDTRINLELARLLNQGGQDDEALSYLEKNLTFTGPDTQGTLELGTKLALTRDPAKKLPTYVKLWSAGTTAPPEDLFLSVFEALRKVKLSSQARDWATHYAGWYPAPQSRDRFLFQQGQLLEEPGEGRDVQASWKAYNEVVRSYPLSPWWKAAGERAAYLNRHFLQVR